MVRDVFITAAKRSPVAPRGGALAHLDLGDLSGPVLRAVATDTDRDGGTHVICGNALGAGGNPARFIALAAGLSEVTAAFSIDTQCCAGLDAIGLGLRLIQSGGADTVLAGGAESFSRAPIRMHRPINKDAVPVPYDRPAFSPWADRDPDMITAAGALADRDRISRTRQETYAIESHAKHRAAAATGSFADEIVPLAGIDTDTFARDLRPATCARLPALAGSNAYAVTAATTAVEADAAAFVRLSSTPVPGDVPIRVIDHMAIGGDPAMPATVPRDAVVAILSRSRNISSADLMCVEVMEAFAVQAIDFIDNAGVSIDRINNDGGALARGHPIAASGAILAVRLVQRLKSAPAGCHGLAVIAGAGGLASALLLRRD